VWRGGGRRWGRHRVGRGGLHPLATAWFAIDPGARQLPPLDEKAVPGTIVIDARTMEIVSAAAGYLPGLDARLEAAAAEVKGRPPSY
jgi:hypothetical protein